ncbi:MAG TPA: hypothetical protein VK425_12280, partial [Acidimicrobiales bacterium]|nr:hypothetical protein [Acidimicrobiales bacterium]
TRLADAHAQVLELVGLIDASVHAWLTAASRVPGLLVVPPRWRHWIAPLSPYLVSLWLAAPSGLLQTFSCPSFRADAEPNAEP